MNWRSLWGISTEKNGRRTKIKTTRSKSLQSDTFRSSLPHCRRLRPFTRVRSCFVPIDVKPITTMETDSFCTHRNDVCLGFCHWRRQEYKYPFRRRKICDKDSYYKTKVRTLCNRKDHLPPELVPIFTFHSLIFFHEGCYSSPSCQKTLKLCKNSSCL